MRAEKPNKEQMFFIWKVLEGALKGDLEKVQSYAQHLAERFETDGEAGSAKRLRDLLKGQAVRQLELTRTGLSAPPVVPVDSESRLAVADEERWESGSVQLVADPTTENVLTRFVRHFREADKLVASGVGVSPSMLLYGPPGTGKTQIARFIAAELGLPLIVSRSDGLISSYLGSTAKNVRLLFEHAASRPCVLFLDEFDALAKMRDDSREVGELKRVVISLLQNIDAIGRDHVLLAATNHEHLLDPAIWRRFAYKVKLELPAEAQREQLLRMFFRGRADDDALRALTILTEGLSGAQLRDIAEDSIREAVLADEPINILRLMDVALTARGLENGSTSAANKVRFLRAGDPKWFTQQRLASLFGISQSQISRYAKSSE